MNTKPTFAPEGEQATAARSRYKLLRERHVPYRYPDDAKLAVRVALAAERPLLLRGKPGSGKSTLAEDVAVCLDWPYYERVITSRTEARDLLFDFDAVRRLGDAQARSKGVDLNAMARYIEPGVLWWAFDPETARRRGHRKVLGTAPEKAVDPAAWQGRLGKGAVVLLDEIDKAEPDVPNDLLVPLGAQRFTVPEVSALIEARRDLLIVITTNDERDLPPAFVRRCIVIELPTPEPADLRAIAKAHYPRVDDGLLGDVLERFDALRKAVKEPEQRPPGTAELLDAVAACSELSLRKGSPGWLSATRAALWKHTDDPPGEGPKHDVAQAARIALESFEEGR